MGLKCMRIATIELFQLKLNNRVVSSMAKMKVLGEQKNLLITIVFCSTIGQTSEFLTMNFTRTYQYSKLYAS